MTHDVLKYLQPNAAIPIDMETTSLLVNALKKALADHAMREVQRLGQEIEQAPVACERCKQLEEQAYDLVGKLRVANIKLSMRPQRTWVGLTDEERSQLVTLHHGWNEYGQAIEDKLKEMNT